MKLFYAICFLLGSLVVFQPALNRMVFEHKGLSFAVLLNASILFCASAIIFLFISLTPERFPEILRLLPYRAFHWWFVLPGLMGFLLVLLVPIMIKHLGAFETVVTMILGQIATSFLWDMYREGAMVTNSRIVGLTLVVIGAYLSFRSRVT